MKKQIYNITLAVLMACLGGLTSCVNDLDVLPIDPDELHPGNVGQSPENYSFMLNKLYAGYATVGQEGSSGNADLGGLDAGASQYMRRLWDAEELPTDEAINAWNDGNLNAFNYASWTITNEFNTIFFDRIYFQVAQSNEFIRIMSALEPTEDLPASEIARYIDEARFIRALSYWHGLNYYGNGIPKVTEENTVGGDRPLPWGTWDGSELFDYLKSELEYLTSNESALKEMGTAYFGYADKGAAAMLLGKLCLNNEVYLGTDNNNAGEYYAVAEEALQSLVNGGYSLTTTDYTNVTAYQSLFAGDNQLQKNEIIFGISYDGAAIQTYGGTTYLMLSSVGGDMKSSDINMNGNWGGNRTTGALYDLFESGDSRRNYFFTGHEKEINNPSLFTDGYGVMKFTNVRTESMDRNDPNGGFADTNFPMFRLADAYLMLAEAELRQGKAVSGTAESGIAAIRERADLSAPASIDLDFILDERGRELYWEAHRRTDLVRFGKFTSGEYVWPWKGNVKDGAEIDAKYRVFPIPSTAINNNSNLVRTPGY
ncbi:RagB/SusD family nutrient uptake outer membrane protein [Limibacter armeniacum]|uniref:RagB/SusD family nutrient uptake outer membrane protein n=1 Tax=Limibacter armeniacum TaxID=466084 RepID=UPI002FE60BFE